MDTGRELVAVKTSGMQRERALPIQIFASDGSMALEHAAQSSWEQGAVGILCAVGGSLLAYWSLQGFVGLAVITLCITFSTLVTAALGYYYDHAVGCQGENDCRTGGLAGKRLSSEM